MRDELRAYTRPIARKKDDGRTNDIGNQHADGHMTGVAGPLRRLGRGDGYG
jgi:hypothetical protein